MAKKKIIYSVRYTQNIYFYWFNNKEYKRQGTIIAIHFYYYGMPVRCYCKRLGTSYTTSHARSLCNQMGADKPKLTTDSHDVPAQHRTVQIQKYRLGPPRRPLGGGQWGQMQRGPGPTGAWLAFEITRSETGSNSF